jgi:hypothetical protein
MARPVFKGPSTLPSATVADKDVTGTFTATGTSASVRSRGVDVSIGGTFVGTVIVERQIGGSWQGIEAVTAPAERFIESDKSRGVRVRCSAYTSGTVTYALEG